MRKRLQRARESLEIERYLEAQNPTCEDDAFERIAKEVEVRAKAREENEPKKEEPSDEPKPHDQEQEAHPSADGSDEHSSDRARGTGVSGSTSVVNETLEAYEAVEVAIEALHSEYRSQHIALLGYEDDAYLQESFLKRLARMGIRLGKSTLVTFKKTAVRLLESLLNAFYSVASALYRFIGAREQSYARYREKLDSAKKAYDALKEVGVRDEERNYERMDVISELKRADAFNVSEALDAMVRFNDAYTRYSESFTRVQLQRFASLIKHFVVERKTPVVLEAGISGVPEGFRRVAQDSDSGLDVYHYSELLPGDRLFVLKLPQAHLEEEALLEAYRQSEAVCALSERDSSVVVKSVTYATLDECGEILEGIEALIAQGELTLKLLKALMKERSGLERFVKTYVAVVLERLHLVTVKDSGILYVARRLAFLDKVIYEALQAITEENTRVLSAAFRYLEDSMDALAKNIDKATEGG